VASQWDKAGITVNTQILDFNTFLQKLSTSDFDALTTVYPFDQPNPNRAINTYTGQPAPAGSNDARGVDPVVENAIAAAEASVGDERCKQWGVVEEQLDKTFAILPLSSPQIFFFSRGLDYFPGASWADVRFLRPAGT
jgi:ABC-type transport system substrate-binding protein